MASNNAFLNIVYYHECRKPHGNQGVFDGCTEYFHSPNGLCAACNCSREDHRRQEVPFNIDPYAVQILAQVPHGGQPPVLPNIQNLVVPGALGIDDEPDEGVVINPPQQRQRTVFTAWQKTHMYLYGVTLRWSLRGHNPENLAAYSSMIGVTPQQLKQWINNHRDEYSLMN